MPSVPSRGHEAQPSRWRPRRPWPREAERAGTALGGVSLPALAVENETLPLPGATGHHRASQQTRLRPKFSRSPQPDPRGLHLPGPTGLTGPRPSLLGLGLHPPGGWKAAVGSVPSKALTSGLQAGPWGVTVINEVEKGSAGAVPACSRRLPCALPRVPIPHPPSTAVALGPAACPATHPARGGAAGLAPPRGGAGATSQDTWAPGQPLTQYEKQSHLERPTPGAPSERGAC